MSRPRQMILSVIGWISKLFLVLLALIYATSGWGSEFISALLGGLAIWLPMVLVGGRLMLSKMAMRQVILAEVLRIVLTIALMVTSVRSYDGLDWKYYLGTLIYMIHAYFVAGLISQQKQSTSV